MCLYGDGSYRYVCADMSVEGDGSNKLIMCANVPVEGDGSSRFFRVRVYL